MSDSNPTSGDTPGVPPAGGTPPPPPPPPPPGGYGQVPAPGIAPNGEEYAPWIWRVLSFGIDYVPVVVIVGIGYLFAAILTTTSEVVREGSVGGTAYSYTTVDSSTSAFGILLIFLCWAIALAYWFWNKGYREGTTGKSIGKSVTGYTTVNEETGEPLGAGMGIVRVLLLYVDFAICYIGVLWPLWDPKRQALLSDKVTKAVVYKD
jgi:uncharacterized RDD family membrane protein YckC